MESLKLTELSINFIVVVAAWKEPVPGWTISKNGPQGFIMGAAKGVVRRLPVNKNLVYDYIPVDIVVNNLVVAGYHSATTRLVIMKVYLQRIFKSPIPHFASGYVPKKVLFKKKLN